MSMLFYILAGLSGATGIVFLFIDTEVSVLAFSGAGSFLLFGAIFKLIALSKEQVSLLKKIVPQKPKEKSQEDDGWNLKG